MRVKDIISNVDYREPSWKTKKYSLQGLGIGKSVEHSEDSPIISQEVFEAGVKDLQKQLSNPSSKSKRASFELVGTEDQTKGETL